MTAAARERAAVRVPLLIVSAAAWLILIGRPTSHAHHPEVFSASGWLWMLAAMMAPVLTGPVRYIRDRSLARQRARSILSFVGGYAAVWMGAGAVLQSTAARLAAVDSSIAIAVF